MVSCATDGRLLRESCSFREDRKHNVASTPRGVSHQIPYFPCKLTVNTFLRYEPPTAVAQGFGETFPSNPKVVSDMTSLHHIHEAGIMYNLGERAKLRNQRPYTFMVSPQVGEDVGVATPPPLGASVHVHLASLVFLLPLGACKPPCCVHDGRAKATPPRTPTGDKANLRH